MVNGESAHSFSIAGGKSSPIPHLLWLYILQTNQDLIRVSRVRLGSCKSLILDPAIT